MSIAPTVDVLAARMRLAADTLDPAGDRIPLVVEPDGVDTPVLWRADDTDRQDAVLIRGDDVPEWLFDLLAPLVVSAPALAGALRAAADAPDGPVAAALAPVADAVIAAGAR